jgi:hypothetical protein
MAQMPRWSRSATGVSITPISGFSVLEQYLTTGKCRAPEWRFLTEAIVGSKALQRARKRPVGQEFRIDRNGAGSGPSGSGIEGKGADLPLPTLCGHSVSAEASRQIVQPYCGL